ncbi:MAG: hypothetical protein IK137_02485 [Bacilli bacterium]|nr:hypothetical protein [Bacilli bacterium]
MGKRILLVVIFVILVLGCIGIYKSNNNGMFVFNKDDNNKIINIENENKELGLKEFSDIVFTKEKNIKNKNEMSDLELIHDAVSISPKYIDTITGSEIKKIVKKYFGINNINLVDITCDLPMSDDHDNRMYIYNSKTDKYKYNPDHISHNDISDGIVYYIMNGKETTEGDHYIYSGEIFYVYNKCGWDVCKSNNIYDVYLSYEDATNKINKQFNAYEKDGLCKKNKCDNNKIYKEIKDNVKTISFYYRKNDKNYVFDYYEVK